MKKLNTTALSVLLALGLAACQPPQADAPASSAGGEQAASGAAGASDAAAGGAINIAVNDKACEPMELTVPSGQVVFNIKNNSSRKLEWEILKGVMVVDDRYPTAGRIRNDLRLPQQPARQTGGYRQRL